jgi:Uma2 family endonuclease
MATILDKPTTAVAAESGDQRVVLHDVDWLGYSRLLQIRGDRSVPRMIYLDGSVEFVSPSYPHEAATSRLGRLVATIAEELEIEYAATRSTTFRRRRKRGGVEGDESYYFENAPALKGKTEINLRVDPPPDLAIEVVHAHSAELAIEVYRRFRVHEVWVWEAGQLRILVLQENGKYAESSPSRVFPFVSAAEIAGWIDRPFEGLEAHWSRELRRWVRDVLAPRHAAGQQPPHT